MRTDVLYFFNVLLWTYEVRPSRYKQLGFNTPHLPFITWEEFQDDAILAYVDAIIDGYDLLTEKSRDMGASWIVLGVFLWFWLFGGSGNDFLIGSRKAEFVDQFGMMDALFPKLRYMIHRLPDWVLPIGFDPRQHDNHSRIQNPETGSTLKGESNNEYFGSGGRYRAVLMDEFAKWKGTDSAAWQSLSDATECRLPVSSANGKSNKFYQVRAGMDGIKVKKLRIHWKKHPLKGKAWYDAEKKRRTPADLAAEVDIDYSASVPNKAIESFNFDIHCGHRVYHNTNQPIILCCDFNINPMSWAMAHQVKDMTLFFDELVDPGRTQTAPHIQEFCNKYAKHKHKVLLLYGDASGKFGSTVSRETDYDIIKRIARSRGWQVVSHVPAGNPPITDRLDATNKRYSDWELDGKNHVLIDPVNCPNLVLANEQTQRKGDGLDKTGGVEHLVDATGYYFVATWPIATRELGRVQRY